VKKETLIRAEPTLARGNKRWWRWKVWK